MPIYEFLCRKCNRVYSFLARVDQADEVPACPQCGNPDMRKCLSNFSVTGLSGSKSGGGEEETSDEEYDPATERELNKLMAKAENMDENNPRELGSLMRRMSDVTGEPMDAETEEAVRRLEKGEDPEKIEEEMGGLFGEEGGGATGGGPDYDDGLYSM